MATTLEDNYKTTLSKKLEPWDTTVDVATAPTTATAWSLYIVRWWVQEWMSFTGVSWTTLTWLTRALSKTTGGTAQTFVGWSTIIITIMSRQLVDKLDDNTFTWDNTFEWTDTFNNIIIDWDTTTPWLKIKNLTTAQRLALTPSNWMIVYDASLWQNFQYVSWAWTTIDAWTVIPVITDEFKATLSANLSLTNSLATVVFGTEEFDSWGNYNNTTWEYTVPTTGKYIMWYNANLSTFPNTWDTVRIELQKWWSSIFTLANANSEQNFDWDWSNIFSFTAWDVLRLQIVNQTAAVWTLFENNATSFFWYKLKS